MQGRDDRRLQEQRRIHKDQHPDPTELRNAYAIALSSRGKRFRGSLAPAWHRRAISLHLHNPGGKTCRRASVRGDPEKNRRDSSLALATYGTVGGTTAQALAMLRAITSSRISTCRLISG